MKYATLAMVATVAATPPTTPAPFAVAAHATACPALTTAETKAVHVANMTKALRKTYLKGLTTLHTDAEHTATTAAAALKTCWGATAADDQKAPTASTDKCAADWNANQTAVNAEWERKCLLDSSTAVTSSKGGGATVGIIIGCVVGVCCIAGAAYYFCVHKKKAEAEGMYSDDLYEAFVDRETA